MLVMKDSRTLELAALRAKTDRQLMAVIEHQLELARVAMRGREPGDAERAARHCSLAQRLLLLLRSGASAELSAPFQKSGSVLDAGLPAGEYSALNRSLPG